MQTSTCSLCTRAFVWVVCTALWIVHFSWASFASCCMRASYQCHNVNTSKTTNKCVWIAVISSELMRIRQYCVSDRWCACLPPYVFSLMYCTNTHSRCKYPYLYFSCHLMSHFTHTCISLSIFHNVLLRHLATHMHPNKASHIFTV